MPKHTKPHLNSIMMKNSVVPRLLRLPEVCSQVGLSKSEIYRRIKAGSFPAPVKLGAKSVAWPDESINEWIRNVIQGKGASV